MAQILNKMLVTSDELESDSTSESKLFKESMTAKGTAARQMHTTRQMPKWRPTYYVATSNNPDKGQQEADRPEVVARAGRQQGERRPEILV